MTEKRRARFATVDEILRLKGEIDDIWIALSKLMAILEGHGIIKGGMGLIVRIEGKDRWKTRESE